MEKIVPEKAVLIPDHARRVFQGEIFDVYQWPQKLFDGSPATFEMIKRPDTVETIGIVDQKILVLEDVQPHRGSRLSLPGGRVDPHESVPDAAKREVQEETGYSFKNWRLLTVRQPQSKIEWFIYTFLAWNQSSQEDPHVDAGEKITAELKSLKQLKDLSASKAGYLGELQTILDRVTRIDDLLDLPEFQGQTVTTS
jgi:ADP-ribose pyrophosphatase